MTVAVVVVPTTVSFSALVTKAEAKLAALVADGEAVALEVYDKVEPIFVAEAENFVEAVGEIALGAVLKQVPLLATGTEKFGAAVADTIEQVEAQGKTLAVADAQTAVQTSFTALGVAKGNLSTPVVVASATV